jgi:prepilin-type N-terminal cleavage/methylation domain-containing protein
MWVVDDKKGESHPREVKMIRNNGGIVGRLYECFGFTLIELVVVIGVVSTLTAIAVPTYLDYKARVHDLSAKVDNNNLLKIANQVILDYNQIYFYHNFDDESEIGEKWYYYSQYFPKIYTLSPLVKAQVRIAHYQYPLGTGTRYSYIDIITYSEKGTADPFGYNGKKYFRVYRNLITGLIYQNY